MDKARVIRAWMRVVVVDKRLSAIENCGDADREQRTNKLQGRYWDAALEKLANEVAAATGVTGVTADWGGGGEMYMTDADGDTFITLYTHDPLLVEVVEKKT